MARKGDAPIHFETWKARMRAADRVIQADSLPSDERECWRCGERNRQKIRVLYLVQGCWVCWRCGYEMAPEPISQFDAVPDTWAADWVA